VKLDTGSITLANAAALLPAGIEAIRGGATVIDLALVREVDSAAVALLIAWQREAQAAGKTIEFAAVPDGIASLAKLYGVAALLGIAQNPRP
jgi:phospholipid transport system transporter-binding protein